jgi:undecaprenyl-diphosphatase
MLQRILEWDRETFIYLNSLGIDRFDGFWTLATDSTTWIPLFVLIFILIFRKFTGEEVLLMSVTALILAIFINFATDLTKEFVERLRPNNNTEINTFIRILRTPSTYSFFSGHAATSFSITTLVVLYLRKKEPWVWLFYIWPFLYSFSRIYLGVHYPTDIIAGAMAGIVSGTVFYLGYLRLIETCLSQARL